MRLFADVLGVGRGRHRRRLLRAGRAFPARHAAGSAGSARPSASQLRRPRRCSTRRPSPASPRASTAADAAARPRWCRRRGRTGAAAVARRSAGCGSSTSSKAASAAYNIPLGAAAARRAGPWPRCAAALGDVVARHESLRTVYPEVDGVPRAARPRRRPGRRAVLTTVPTTERGPDGRGDAAPRRDRLRPRRRDRRCGPRCSRSAPSEHVLVLVLHHIAGDGWSLGPLPRDLADAYAARRRRRRAPVDAAAGAVRRLRALAARSARRRGRPGQRARPPARPTGATRSPGCPTSWTCPPTGRARRPRPTRRRAGPVRRSTPTLHARGSPTLARASGASLFMVLQAALAALLSRLGAGHRHPDRHPGRRPQRRRARRRSSASSSTRWCCAPTPRGDPAFTRAARPGAGDRPGRLRQPGPAVRAAGRGAQPAPLARPAPAVPGDAVSAERPPRRRSTLPGLELAPEPCRLRRRPVRPVARPQGALRRRRHARPGIVALPSTRTDLFDRSTAETLLARFARLLESFVAAPARRSAPRRCSPPTSGGGCSVR